MRTKLWCHPSYDLGNHRGWSRLIDVVDEAGQRIEHFELMCSAIDNDGIPEVMAIIERVERGEVAHDGMTGDGWDTHITRGKVWFESLYNDGSGGAVSLAQYKLALETYLRFVSDPERKPIEVEFPER